MNTTTTRDLLQHEMDERGNDQLGAVKAMNALSSFALSAIITFLPVFFSSTFDKLQIGILGSIPCLASILAPPLWGAIADVLQKQRVVHVFCILTGAVLMFAIQFTSTSFYLTCAVAFLANVQTMPTCSLLDQCVLALLRRVGGEYGKQRLFGAVGWGLGAFLTGVVVHMYGIRSVFYLHLVASLPTVVVLRLIPPPDMPSSSPENVSFVDGLRSLVRTSSIPPLLFLVLLMGLMFGVIGSFLGLYLYELSGRSALLVGLVTWVQTLSELPAFFFADALTHRVGIASVLALSIVAYGVRLVAYANLTNGWTVLPFELLHGVTFAFAWAACTEFVFDAAPRGTHGTAMGLLNAALTGWGRGLGTLFGGYLYQEYGAKTMWLVTATVVPVALLGLVWFARILKTDTTTRTADSAPMKIL
ncbi:Aste57867_20072 [Aphanomyces stellatus]|uniref:Aste57867_20072 protein n=1 Tax=Aphanomyces stellatus TaxID=120398 RepID=A0A485LG24_9STRA|nr:hypothetical protein As57867_020006 [Aphanomyces stellatus]VFT96767.1 Aste57867_20072 [Aphanomyces stellatus]